MSQPTPDLKFELTPFYWFRYNREIDAGKESAYIIVAGSENNRMIVQHIGETANLAGRIVGHEKIRALKSIHGLADKDISIIHTDLLCAGWGLRLDRKSVQATICELLGAPLPNYHYNPPYKFGAVNFLLGERRLEDLLIYPK